MSSQCCRWAAVLRFRRGPATVMRNLDIRRPNIRHRGIRHRGIRHRDTPRRDTRMIRMRRAIPATEAARQQLLKTAWRCRWSSWAANGATSTGTTIGVGRLSRTGERRIRNRVRHQPVSLAADRQPTDQRSRQGTRSTSAATNVHPANAADRADST